MFDSVAIGMVLWPELFETIEMYICVDDEGYTKVDNTYAAICTVGMKINKMEFLQRMYRKLVEQNF
jgi:inosine-uridine nucleoside N-ribohydrolase